MDTYLKIKQILHYSNLNKQIRYSNTTIKVKILYIVLASRVRTCFTFTYWHNLIYVYKKK